MELTVKALKYFLLSLAGCTIAYIASVVLELSVITHMAIALLEQVLSRALVLVICLLAMAVITESLRG
jgi:hypothetical protein